MNKKAIKIIINSIFYIILIISMIFAITLTCIYFCGEQIVIDNYFNKNSEIVNAKKQIEVFYNTNNFDNIVNIIYLEHSDKEIYVFKVIKNDENNNIVYSAYDKRRNLLFTEFTTLSELLNKTNYESNYIEFEY